MRKTEIREAIERLEELKETIYEAIDEMEDILGEVAPEELERARSYWMAHIDGALENRGQWLGEASLVSYIDTIEALEEMMEMEEERENRVIKVFEYQLYGNYCCCKCGEPLFKCVGIRETEDEDGHNWRSFCKNDYEELKASGMTDEEIYDSFETNKQIEG